ncbi:hypothetical protein [Paraclostridium tenue]|uniref:Uncharacterized protein n=1 Tax=Paraclostridium tenue TaxID=1737 RepID=A0ABP3XNI2_9FIRM
MSNIFKKIKEQQNKNKIKNKEENEKVFKCINMPIPIPQPIRLINTGITNMESYRYRVVTKDDFIRYMATCNKTENAFKTAKDRWDRIRKGYNFVIAVGNEDLMFYSIDSFNKLIGGSIDDKE